MNWLDVCGPPGSGKSTVCDHFWGPHSLPIENQLPLQSWDGFVNETTRLFYLIKDHPTIGAAVRMNNRSFRKVSTVARKGGSFPYTQTCLAQRGFGFGWRMVDLGIDINKLRPFFELMPVSIGVAVTRCPADIVKQRNKDREKVKHTAHENRSHMVDLMQPAIELAIEVLHGRGVPILEIDTTGSIDESRKRLIAFALENLDHAKTNGSGGEMAPLSSPPPWWQ